MLGFGLFALGDRLSPLYADSRKPHQSRENNQINDARRVITESVLRAIEKIR